MSDNFLKDFEWESYETLKSQYVKLYDEHMKLKKRSNEQYGMSYFIHKQIIKDYISKDKIISKIALLKKSKKWYLNGEKQYFSTFDMINSKIDLLKELLEDGD